MTNPPKKNILDQWKSRDWMSSIPDTDAGKNLREMLATPQGQDLMRLIDGLMNYMGHMGERFGIKLGGSGNTGPAADLTAYTKEVESTFEQLGQNPNTDNLTRALQGLAGKTFDFATPSLKQDYDMQISGFVNALAADGLSADDITLISKQVVEAAKETGLQLKTITPATTPAATPGGTPTLTVTPFTTTTLPGVQVAIPPASTTMATGQPLDLDTMVSAAEGAMKKAGLPVSGLGVAKDTMRNAFADGKLNGQDFHAMASAIGNTTISARDLPRQQMTDMLRDSMGRMGRGGPETDANIQRMMDDVYADGVINAADLHRLADSLGNASVEVVKPQSTNETGFKPVLTNGIAPLTTTLPGVQVAIPTAPTTTAGMQIVVSNGTKPQEWYALPQPAGHKASEMASLGHNEFGKDRPAELADLFSNRQDPESAKRVTGLTAENNLIRDRQLDAGQKLQPMTPT
jgi:hypothetical protein